MMKRVLIVALALSAGAVGRGLCQYVTEQIPPEERLRSVEIVELRRKVIRAGELIKKMGEKAFAVFRKPGSEWNNYEQAIFVVNATEGHENEGLFVVYPSVEYVGMGAMDMSSVNGRHFARKATIEKKKEKKKDWLDLIVDEPLEYPRSSTVAESLEGRSYAITAGRHNLDQEIQFVIDLVNAACAVVREAGLEKAYRVFSEKGSIFEFKDTYIFVVESGGKILLDPGNPQYVGKNVADIKYFKRAIAPDYLTALKAYQAGDYPQSSKKSFEKWYEVLKKNGYGWAFYHAPRPGKKELSLKASYSRLITVKGKEYIVGSGIYVVEPAVKPAKD